MQENADPHTPNIGRTQQLFETAVNSGFDQIFKGDVIIKKLKNKHEYRITFSKIYGDRFLFYQVFNKDNTDNVNDKRFAAYIPVKNIINMYNMYNANANSRFSNKLVFTPTTIMELPNFSKYAFVINKIYFNSHKRIVLIVSTKEINIRNTSSSKKLIQIPCGKFKHVRFDVDAPNIPTLKDIWSSTSQKCENNPTEVFFANNGISYQYCNKPLPQFPEVCDDASGSKDITKCTNLIKQMVKDRTLPDSLLYYIGTLPFTCNTLH